jgi:uncharacterized protein (TIGR02231 family)
VFSFSNNLEEIMKISILSALLLSASASLAFAGDVQVASHVDAVTVYPEGADVARLAQVDVPKGESTLLFDDLPQSVDPQSVRVEGNGALEIISVDTKLSSNSAQTMDAPHRQLQADMEKLSDERGALDQVISDQDAQRKLLLALADKQLSPSMPNEPGKLVDGSTLDALLGAVGNRLAATSKTIHEAQLRQRQIDKDLADLNLKLAALPPSLPQHLQTAVHVTALNATSAALKLSYRVNEAGWHAFYDAKLALPKAGSDAQLALVRRAEVQQNTGEAWNNVALVLSTAQPSGNAQVPDLPESEVSIAPPPILAGDVQIDRKVEDSAMLERLPVAAAKALNYEAQPAAPIKQKEAVVQEAGFDAQYLIADRTSIDNSGTAKKVRIGTDNLPVKLTVESVPRLDSNAYLSVAFTTPSEAALLAGPVNLFRDEAYVGQVEIDEIAAGDEAKLGFGVDDLVKVKRVEVKRFAAQEGILTSSSTQEMAWNISVTNLHDMKMPIRILDRKPFSSDAKITVADVAGATAASVVDVDHKRGVLAWDLNLDAKGKAEIKTGYKVVAPDKTRLSLEE